VESSGGFDAGTVETEPDPEEPFSNGEEVGALVVGEGRVGEVGHCCVRSHEPEETEEKPGETPDGDECEAGEVAHHGVEGDEDDVIWHEVEGDSGEEDRRRDAEDREGKVLGFWARDDQPDLGDADEGVDAEDEDEGDVEEAPEVLGVDLPAVLDDGGELLEDPAGGEDGEGGLVDGDVGLVGGVVVAVVHGEDVEDQEDGEVEELEEVAQLGDDQPAVVEDVGAAGLVQRDGVLLVVVWDDVDEGHGRVDYDSFVDGVDHALAGEGADEDLALGEDGQFEGGELAFVSVALLACPGTAVAAGHGWGGVEGVEARDEDVGEEEEARAVGVVLVEAAEDAGGDQLAEVGAGDVDALVDGGRVGLGAEELDSVGEEAVDCILGVSGAPG